MKTLQVQEVSLSFGDREILKDISFNMQEGTRAALSGANGSGKSTLLKVLTGKMQGDSIKVSTTKGARLSYLPQSDIVLPDKSVYDTAEEGYKRFDEIKDKISMLEEKTQAGGNEALKSAEQLAEMHELLLQSGYYDRKARIEKILQGLGFKTSDFARHASEFSGGYQMRIALARVLVENPDFMLLDEPTNYLDIEALTWLEGYLKGFDGGLMIVSHDQDFLDDLVTEVYELFQGKLTRYQGNYSKYLTTREEEIEALEKAYKRQQEEIEKTEEFIERFRYKATKAKQVQSRIKQLEKIDTIEIPSHLKKLTFSFPPSPHSGNDILKVENLSKSFGENIIYKDFSFMIKKKERLAITGRNGAGKSTLLRILAGIDNAYTGSVIDGSGVIKGYFAQDTENTLINSNSVIEELDEVEKIIIGMGEWGICTRILYKKLDSILTFASNTEIAPGQISAKTLKTVYHADMLNKDTAVYGIIGNPVMHTSSPLIHNPGFRAINYNAVYVPFLVDNVRSFFTLAEHLKIRGFSVTIPFKVDVLSYLGNITREVKQIGSCNTVVRVPNMWKGINTDYYGFLAPIEKDIENGRIKNALVIGAGGASQAIVWGLRNRGVSIVILNRTLSHAEKLAKINRCQFDTLDNAKEYEGKVDLIVQTTSVGLYPDFDMNPIEGFEFSGNEIVYDIIYKPRMTKLLKEAEKKGCKLHFGSEMLLEQGKLQFEAFTGYHYPKTIDISL